jgi:hypothetical protein
MFRKVSYSLLKLIVTISVQNLSLLVYDLYFWCLLSVEKSFWELIKKHTHFWNLGFESPQLIDSM